MSQHTTLLVVIVNYRTASLVVDCLSSLAGEVDSYPGVRVVVADNASGDDSVERLRCVINDHDWTSWVAIRPLPRNGGFAWGNNQAIRPAMESDDPPDYVLLLNPDTVVRPGALSELIAFLEGHPEVGIAGSRLEDPDGTPQTSAFRFHSILGELENGLRLGLATGLLARRVVAPQPPDEPCPTDWVSGASMIVRREVFEKVGLLDDSYFMYYEETDFCLRARRADWPCWYVPGSRVVHLVGQSSGLHDRLRPRTRLPAYWFQSRRRYFLKNHGAVKTVVANLVWVLAYSTWRFRRILQRKPDRDPEGMLADFLRYNFLPRSVIGNHTTTRRDHSLDGSRAVPPVTAPSLDALGIVVIGRDEGERLRVCLESAVGHGAVVVYVDSGSADGSVALAHSLGADVVELDASIPFSAARARNAGFERLRHVAREGTFVQFVDGDCELAQGWLERGLRELSARGDVAAVCGRLRERFPERSIYNRLADLEWDATTGEVEDLGGIAMMRIEAFQNVGGFDPTITAGEEPELCRRLRVAGWSVVRLVDEMARHDLNAESFGPWWRRQVRSGYGSLEVTRRLAGSGPFMRQVRSVRIWTVGWLSAAVVLSVPAYLLIGPVPGACAASVVGLAPALQALRLAVRVRKRVRDVRTALGYGALTMVGKWGELAGQIVYLRDRAAGRRAGLAGCKTAAESARTALELSS
jgi:GT2 family glycosyltransferase